MSRKNSLSCILNLLLSLSLHGLVLAEGSNVGQEPQNQRETAQEIKVTVLVHNYAHLPKQILSDAKDRASLIFHKAGVEVEWADCPLKDEDPSLYPECPATVDASQLFLRILPKTAGKMQDGGQAFVAARIANIFWNRVEEQAQRLNVSAARVMGHTVAHELGHLLLGSNSHSSVGIMTARWDAPTMTRICQEGLYFNSQQSELIRSEMKKRKDQLRIVENALLIPQTHSRLVVPALAGPPEGGTTNGDAAIKTTFTL
jgi:hypothetical protein